MKAKCIRIINLDTGEDEGRSNGWLNVSSLYTVFEVSIDFNSNDIQYRVLSDENETPYLAAAEQFEIVDSVLPMNWLVESYGEGSIVLGPKEWSQGGYLGKNSFWDDFFDDIPRAAAVYGNEFIRRMGRKPNYPRNSLYTDELLNQGGDASLEFPWMERESP